MVGYELYSMGYLIWYPGSHHVEKAKDVIFHEEVITPAILALYNDNDTPQNVSERNIKKDIAEIPPETYPRLFIRISTCPKHAEYGPKDKDHATIEEISLDQPYTDESKLISHILDFPQGTMHSMKQCGEIQSLVSTENLQEAMILSTNIPGEPTNIKDALDLPGNEGRAWECAHQTEWQNMIDHDIFGLSEEPPLNMHILKMGTML